ncbi:MAG: translation initiation factor IF-3 [Chloroflexi bacterium]|nr:translation initiation factor IF-3 [Chloroflexota bacterium]
MARDYRINHRIRAREIRLIGDNGEQLGVMSLSDALQAAEDADLDLVEVAGQADPPVCRLLEYGRFRYEQSKKERESRKSQKHVELREVRMRPRIDEHDIAFKSRMVKKFLEDGHKVKMSVLFRGREITHPELAMGLMRRVAESLQDQAKLEKPPGMEGRTMTMVLAPIGTKTSSESKSRGKSEKEKTSAKT